MPPPAEVLADAVLRGVRAAASLHGAGLPDLPAARDLPMKTTPRS